MSTRPTTGKVKLLPMSMPACREDTVDAMCVEDGSKPCKRSNSSRDIIRLWPRSQPPCAPRAGVKHGVVPTKSFPSWEWQLTTMNERSSADRPCSASFVSTTLIFAAGFVAVGNDPGNCRTSSDIKDGKLCIGIARGQINA